MSHPFAFRIGVALALALWVPLVRWALPGALQACGAARLRRIQNAQRIAEAQDMVRELRRAERVSRSAERIAEKRHALNASPVAAELHRRHLENLLAIRRAERELER